MRYLILIVAGLYAYLAVDGLESSNRNLEAKKPYRARAAVVILALVTVIFAQSANSLEGKLEANEIKLTNAEEQNAQLASQISGLQTQNSQLQDRLNALLVSSQLSLPNVPASGNGATAKCVDGTLSFAANHRGACSHHGGVAEWYR